MFRFLVPLVLAVSMSTAVAAAPVDDQSRRPRDNDRRERQVEASPQRVDLGDVVRRVASGRQGRMLGVSPRGDVVVVRWEYPGGRVADITVDGRSGRILGER